MTTTTITEQINAELAKAKPNTYKIKSLKEKLSLAKAEEKGNIVTIEHLKEYRRLIIWIMEQKLVNKNNLAAAMKELAGRKIVYKTEKSIKRLICEEAKKAAYIAEYEIFINLYGAAAATRNNKNFVYLKTKHGLAV